MRLNSDDLAFADEFDGMNDRSSLDRHGEGYGRMFQNGGGHFEQQASDTHIPASRLKFRNRGA